MLGILIMPFGLCSGGTRSVPSERERKARARVPRMKAAVLERRTALAREWILNEGFYAPCKDLDDLLLGERAHVRLRYWVREYGKK